jgi:chromosome segregation ATPase
MPHNREALIAQYEQLATDYEGVREARRALKEKQRSLQEAIQAALRKQKELEAILARQSAPVG